MKNRALFFAGLSLFIVGAIILAIMGITEVTRGLVTPCFAFGMMFVIYGWPGRKKAKKPQE